jgi:hypothetical protein
MALVVVLLSMAQYVSRGIAQSSLRVRVDRWLELQQFAGTVKMQRLAKSQPAKRGDRLQNPGDGLSTAKNSDATLLVDTGIGVINVSESTDLEVQGLEMAPDNGRITRLKVTRGQVRLKVRPFTHRGSQLEIQSPASLSGVRGTDFGLTIQPNGKTGLAVSEGSVTSSAQGQTIAVPQGFQNFTFPGEPPAPPVPLTNSTQLRHRFEPTITNGVRRVRLIGRVDPVNSVLVDDVPQTTDRNGQFTTPLRSLPSFLKVRVTVTTPLGKTEVYDLAFR